MNRVYNESYYEDYYKIGNGSEYSDKERYYIFFNTIAELLIKNYRPETVLDVGCAYGYLVEALREKGVQAYGVDISEHAIENAAESIQPYVRVNSATDSLPDDFPKHFDVIISIEVLEHMTVEDGERALEQLCRMTDIFVFSSSDSDLNDVTHINVQRKEYWARIFAKQGFFRDVQTPASYISRCADVYRRRNDIYNVIQEYEVVLRAQKLNAVKRKIDSLIYYDTGKGLREEEKIAVDYGMDASGNISLSFELPENTRMFRYDPVHVPCILSELEVTAEGETAEVIPINAEIHNEMWVFNTSGPQVMVQLQEKSGRKRRRLAIKGKLYLPENIQWVLYRLQEENAQKLLDEAEGNSATFNSKFSELGERLEVLFREKEQEAGRIRSEKENLQKEMQEVKENYGSQLQQKEQQLERLCFERERLQKEMQAERTNYGSQLQQKEQELERLCFEKESLQKEMQAERTDYENRLQQQEQQLEKLCFEKKGLQKEMQAERANYENRLQQQEQQLERLCFEKEDLQKEIQKTRENCESQLQQKEQQISRLSYEQENLNQELRDLKSNYEELQKQYSAVVGELASSREVCSAYENAFFWKLTRPARMLTDKIKKLRLKVRRLLFVRNIKKVFVSLRKNGFRKTGDKIKKYFSRKKRARIYGENFELPEIEREQQEKAIFKRNIIFSILVPLYNTPLNFLSEMIDSVVKQTYSGWELCLADGSDSNHKKVESYCKKYQKKDARIKYQKLEKNGGISENTNACIDMAEGEYIGLFDHDDLLHPTALYEMMCAIEKENPDFLYTDEAVFEGSIKNIITIHFKPDYGIDTLRANNYICHFSVFRRSLLEKVGRFRSEYDGSQDHDLVLRLTNNANRICHISKVLYYWRSHPASVASDIESKPYASEAGRKAVQASLEACGQKGLVESSEFFPAIYRVRYEIAGSPLISIVIQCRDCCAEVERCMQSIVGRSTYKHFEIILVDDNSKQHETFEYYRGLSKRYKNKIRVLHWRKNYNYAALNNYAVQQARGEYIVLLHSDITVITSSWLEELLMYAQRKDVGAVGAKLYYENDTVRHAGMILGMGEDGCVGYAHAGLPKDNFGYMGRLYYAQDMSIVSSACLMVKKAIYQKTGGFDEAYRMKYSDADFCMKLRKAGYLNVFTPYAELYHFKQRISLEKGEKETLGGGEKEKETQEDIKKFRSRWKKELQEGDPYFNQNFDLENECFIMKG